MFKFICAVDVCKTFSQEAKIIESFSNILQWIEYQSFYASGLSRNYLWLPDKWEKSNFQEISWPSRLEGSNVDI